MSKKLEASIASITKLKNFTKFLPPRPTKDPAVAHVCRERYLATCGRRDVFFCGRAFLHDAVLWYGTHARNPTAARAAIIQLVALWKSLTWRAIGWFFRHWIHWRAEKKVNCQKYLRVFIFQKLCVCYFKRILRHKNEQRHGYLDRRLSIALCLAFTKRWCELVSLLCVWHIKAQSTSRQRETV